MSLERAPKNDGGNAYRFVNVVVYTRASWYDVVFMRPAIVGIGVTVREKVSQRELQAMDKKMIMADEQTDIGW